MRIGYKIEEIASYILEMLGYQILDRRRRIVKDEEEIGEVDIIAKRNGEMYAVEVKSGTISVSDIRQAYMNALFLGFKPLIIGRGISDEAAAITARELGVKYILLPEYILMRLTDLKELIERILLKFIYIYESIDSSLYREDDIKVLETIVSTSDISMAAKKLGIGVKNLGKKISAMRRRGLFIYPIRNYRDLVIQARVILGKIKRERNI